MNNNCNWKYNFEPGKRLVLPEINKNVWMGFQKKTYVARNEFLKTIFAFINCKKSR